MTKQCKEYITHCYYSPDNEQRFTVFLPISLSARAVLNALVLLQRVQAWTMAIA